MMAATRSSRTRSRAGALRSWLQDTSVVEVVLSHVVADAGIAVLEYEACMVLLARTSTL